jgi:hypothetical protein
LQAELSALQSAAQPDEPMGVIVFDEAELEKSLDAEYKIESEHERQKIEEYQRGHDFGIAKRTRELASAASAELETEERQFDVKSEEYLRIDEEYEAIYDREQAVLAEAWQLPTCDLFSKSDRLIENLKHQQYQLKSSIKFQRVALDSEWKLKFDQENAHFEEVSIEFAQHFNKLQLLFDSQTAIDEFRGKANQEIVDLEAELSTLQKGNEKIHSQFALEKEATSSGDGLRTFLEQAKLESATRLEDSMSSVAIDCSQIRLLISEVSGGIETDKQLLTREIQKLLQSRRDAELELCRRGEASVRKLNKEMRHVTRNAEK